MPEVLIKDIVVDERIRTNLGDLSVIKASIVRHGLIQPIAVTRDHVLLAGARRLTCFKELGRTHIEVNYVDAPDSITRKLIEQAENRHRRDFSIREDHNGIVSTYMEWKQLDPTVTQEQVGQVFGLTKGSISQHMFVEEWRKRDPSVDKALDNGFMTAYNAADRARKRRDEDSLEEVAFELISEPDPEEAEEPLIDQAGMVADGTAPDGLAVKHAHVTHPTIHAEILHADFAEWAAAYTGPRFNLIHCDFPYGINEHKNARQNSASQAGYDDSPEAWLRAKDAFVTHLDRFCAPSAHLIFWFHANRQREVMDMLEGLPGFQFETYELVWVRGNEGVLPRPDQGPRRTYEKAYFGWRGGRVLTATGARANHFECATNADSHEHAKPEAALRHWFEMVVDEGTRMLDPTCGSGSAVRVAKALGAKYALGLEMNPEYTDRAQRSLRRMDVSQSDIDYETLLAAGL